MRFFVSFQYFFAAGLIAAFCILGVVMTFDMPPFQVADEDLHWVVALDRSEQIIAALRMREPSPCSSGVTLPDHFEVGGLKDATTRLPPHKFETLGKVHVSCNSRPVISYGTVFTYPGVLLGRLLVRDEVMNPVRALAVFYFARFFHGLIAAGLLIRMLWLARERRFSLGAGFTSLFAFCLAPIFLNQSFAVSGDAVVLLFSVALAGWLIFWSEVKLFDAAALVVLGILACSTKPVMLPAGLSVVTAHYLFRSFSIGSGEATGPKGGAFVLGSAAVWIFAAFSVTAYDYMMLETTYKAMTSIDPSKNWAFLAADLGRAWGILWGSLYPFLSLEFVASPLGWNNVPIPIGTIDQWRLVLWIALGLDLVLTAAFTLSEISEMRKHCLVCRLGITALHGCIVFAGVLAFLLLTALALYLRWTPEGNPGVVGLQRRYFLPFFIIGFAELITLSSFGAAQLDDPSRERSVHGTVGIGAGAAAGLVVSGLLLVGYVCALYVDIMARYQ